MVRICRGGTTGLGITNPFGSAGVVAALLVAALPVISGADVIEVSTAAELQELFSRPLYDVEVRLLPGAYHLTPKSAIDSTCGNCEDADTPVPITFGVRITGEKVRIHGPEGEPAVIYTHAGYGLFFDRCSECRIEGVSITGGVRDPDGNATDAAIVVKKSLVDVVANRIFDNVGDSTTVNSTVVGIMGICGREGSEILIEGNEIIRNSWDGIALYRDASAKILGNVIDGVDKARGKEIGGGRGVAIGVTWNATADIRGNVVKRYWKGIGIFVDAWGSVRNNVIEDIITWGIAFWDAGKGKPVGIFEDNVIYYTGACGASITCSSTADARMGSRFTRNIIVKTAQNPKYDDPDYYCYQTSLARHEVPEGFDITGNLFFDNRRASDDLPDYDMNREAFLNSVGSACEWLSKAAIFSTTDFVATFCSDKNSP
ncbi:MAG: right-handed parallel beta-helix repeat-containing protein [Candidatus Latescibacterota bacterium]|nr:MAG: right-handed parallel beta-helix repeat-containing protein [Candidatus Latescibacterota bacterium]